MFIQYIFIVFEELSSDFGVSVWSGGVEFVKIGVCSDDFGVGFFGIEYDVEEGDGATGITCVLFHEEHVRGYLFRF